MLSKKYIFVLAFAGLVVSCQKEIIRPNATQTTVISDEDNSVSLKISTDAEKNSTLVGKSSIDDVTGTRNSSGTYTNGIVFKSDSDITDPNNDEDRNKKKRN